MLLLKAEQREDNSNAAVGSMLYILPNQQIALLNKFNKVNKTQKLIKLIKKETQLYAGVSS